MFRPPPYLETREADQKFIRQELNDNHIYYFWNKQSHKQEAWYKPDSSRAYKITAAENVSHAVRILGDMLKFEKEKAEDILKRIDEHNEKIVQDKNDDAMAEVRHDLHNILNGKQYFVMANMQARRQNAYV